MIEIRRITEERRLDINLPNEPFALWGRLKPAFDGCHWSYATETFADDEVSEMIFPDEHYVFDELQDECFFVGAYTGDGECVGLAIYRKDWRKYLYLEDLKVNRQCRRQGVGQQLIDEGKKIAAENGYIGLYTVGQDNNLSACLFYLRAGFEIGGIDTRVYRGTKQEGKSDIYFYLDV